MKTDHLMLGLGTFKPLGGYCVFLLTKWIKAFVTSLKGSPR